MRRPLRWLWREVNSPTYLICLYLIILGTCWGDMRSQHGWWKLVDLIAVFAMAFCATYTWRQERQRVLRKYRAALYRARRGAYTDLTEWFFDGFKSQKEGL